jgi:NADH:ubiquinone oxidoreductase subunit F (NADH-binding)
MMSVLVDHLLAGTATGRPIELEQHEAIHGPLPRPGARELVEEVAHAGLVGRGGAGFPTARKLSRVAAQPGRKVVVANAAETEPMSQKDRVLIELAPHLVLDGLELAGDAIGAETRIVALGSRAAHLHSRLEAAIRARRSRGLQVVELPAHYLAGQETALVNVIGGGRVKPRPVPPFPADEGVRGRPTLIQNAETFAHLALIARHGADWFRSGGTDSSPGSLLVSLGGAIDRPGVYEIRGGSRLGDVIDLAGGVRGNLRGVLVGGYFGTWLGPEGTEMHLDAVRLARHGASIGTGVVAILDDRHCPVAEVTRVAAWMASQSAGQCGPCSNGLPAIARELEAMATGRGRRDSHHLLQRWGGMVQRRGACHHPDGTARFVLSALEVFHDEFREHGRRGPCGLCNAPAALTVPAGERLAA